MRADALIVWSERPLNAETAPELLCRADVTPTERFFVRCHGTLPEVDAAAFRLTVGGRVERPLRLSLSELRERFPRAAVEATLACAGNRRNELTPPAEGIPWGAGAIGNATWGGVRLRDVMNAAGVGPAARHVAFSGLDEAEGERFGGSIPLEKALAADVLLADEMNGEPLPVEHGFPLRVIVPGYIGARSVKWLTSVSLQREPSASYFQWQDYALHGAPLGELRLTSALCRQTAHGAALAVEGYALGAGGAPVERVEVSSDGGDTWQPADVRGAAAGRWGLWRADVEPKPGARTLVVRAFDSSGARQPENAEWNRKGYMNNAWQRVPVGGHAGRPRVST